MTTGEWDKQAWRAEILARRAAVSAEQHATEAAALAAGVTALRASGWVCAYVPVGTEPGSLALLDALRAGGARVLLPVTGPPGPLTWGEYLGGDRLRRARYGLLEPDGPPVPDALGLAELILIPALAVDRRGVRLGRGAGYYDRTLHAAHPTARLIAVVRDDELVDHLPEEPHDHRMGWALTPHHGLRQLAADTND
ncbi:5-formyltetrahydrofolate cyclo-ligase [Nocardia otitidiscaviarum]|uniref:5-formyltetrahydrofolate cyclo-ligase n=1 Tax=Nocardia otitidiscaviarum TaxID=1823 RepID=UPI001893FF00|nr:5-formyltetrahydrofolate cyclo-ligase [Nocardia otitidiscaviarum]MBF6178462.1 5-formyltetrahydrofolate cyclo-ligase [Nocardia otitidiscaviarum]